MQPNLVMERRRPQQPAPGERLHKKLKTGKEERTEGPQHCLTLTLVSTPAPQPVSHDVLMAIRVIQGITVPINPHPSAAAVTTGTELSPACVFLPACVQTTRLDRLPTNLASSASPDLLGPCLPASCVSFADDSRPCPAAVSFHVQPIDFDCPPSHPELVLQLVRPLPPAAPPDGHFPSAASSSMHCPPADVSSIHSAGADPHDFHMALASGHFTSTGSHMPMPNPTPFKASPSMHCPAADASLSTHCPHFSTQANAPADNLQPIVSTHSFTTAVQPMGLKRKLLFTPGPRLRQRMSLFPFFPAASQDVV